ncbi:hypothetical protein THICB2_510002 [Thiomonas sp. CB2]|nr:hypothetical protein THICB2_510002 [Thiomonas sp. CB2]VDY04340.1 protein of unknown function [Thiomonas sp. Bio17B3]VDY08487.1 protein of unknown function [Thiomonas sp. Sup16B3]VDY12585.1 conserved protein of unknown function [Thiomonas sp. OC7]VDY18203.1 protein of unknown function [Thiomonas sp. CB2]
MLVAGCILLLAIALGRLLDVYGTPGTSSALDLLIPVLIAPICALAGVIVAFDEARRSVLVRLRARHACTRWLLRAWRALLRTAAGVLSRALNRLRQVQAAVLPPQTRVGGRAVPTHALCRRLQRGQRPRVPAAGGLGWDRC